MAMVPTKANERAVPAVREADGRLRLLRRVDLRRGRVIKVAVTDEAMPAPEPKYLTRALGIRGPIRREDIYGEGAI